MFPKKKQEDDGMEGNAKMKVLNELRSSMSDMMGNKMKSGMDGIQKVSVMAPNKEGLEKGLNKAEEIVATAPEAHTPEISSDETPKMSVEEIDEAISILQQLKADMAGSPEAPSKDSTEEDDTEEMV